VAWEFFIHKLVRDGEELSKLAKTGDKIAIKAGRIWISSWKCNKNSKIGC